jgi:DNA polymerase-3 subunit delta'
MKSKKSQQSELRLALPRENAHLFGHDQILADIFTAYNKKSMPGGWLISGVAGIGKATLAYRIAKFVLYHGKKGTSGLFGSQESADLSVPQNSQSSLKVSAGTHPDLLVLESGGDDEKSIRGDILIEDARISDCYY